MTTIGTGKFERAALVEPLALWSDEKLLLEWEKRAEASDTFAGSVYRGILSVEMMDLDSEAMRRHGLSLDYWRSRGVVPTSWTDEFGVTHDYAVSCPAKVNRAGHVRRFIDNPIKVTTCLMCIGG